MSHQKRTENSSDKMRRRYLKTTDSIQIDNFKKQISNTGFHMVKSDIIKINISALIRVNDDFSSQD